VFLARCKFSNAFRVASTLSIICFSGCIGSALSLLRDARPREKNVSSSAVEFWKAVDRWNTNQVSIVLEFVRAASPQLQERFTGTVIRADKPSVLFRDVKTGKAHPIDFGNADIFIGGFELVEPFGMVRVFDVDWENAELLTCTLMEPQETAIAN